MKLKYFLHDLYRFIAPILFDIQKGYLDVWYQFFCLYLWLSSVIIYFVATAEADYEYLDKDCFRRKNRLAVM